MDISQLWQTPIELLRGHAHRSAILTAQKAVKDQLAANAKAKEDGKEPVFTDISIAKEYNRVLSVFPTVQDVTPAASPTRSSKPKEPTLADAAAATKEMSKSETLAYLRAQGFAV